LNVAGGALPVRWMIAKSASSLDKMIAFILITLEFRQCYVVFDFHHCPTFFAPLSVVFLKVVKSLISRRFLLEVLS
jgi:hypothetical protein